MRSPVSLLENEFVLGMSVVCMFPIITTVPGSCGVATGWFNELCVLRVHVCRVVEDECLNEGGKKWPDYSKV